MLVCLSVLSGIAWTPAQAQSDDCANLFVVLKETTLLDKFRWGAQAVILPERLDDVVPLYAYPSGAVENAANSAVDIDANIPPPDRGGEVENAAIDNFWTGLQSTDISVGDFRIGKAAFQNNRGHDVWRGTQLVRPNEADSLGLCIDWNDDDLWYIVTVPVVGLESSEEQLWTSTSASELWVSE